MIFFLSLSTDNADAADSLSSLLSALSVLSVLSVSSVDRPTSFVVLSRQQHHAHLYLCSAVRAKSHCLHSGLRSGSGRWSGRGCFGGRRYRLICFLSPHIPHQSLAFLRVMHIAIAHRKQIGHFHLQCFSKSVERVDSHVLLCQEIADSRLCLTHSIGELCHSYTLISHDLLDKSLVVITCLYLSCHNL